MYKYPVPLFCGFSYNIIIPTQSDCRQPCLSITTCPLEASSLDFYLHPHYLHPQLSSTSPLALVSFSLSSILQLVKILSHWQWTPLAISSLPRNPRRCSFRSSRSLQLPPSNHPQPLPCPNPPPAFSTRLLYASYLSWSVLFSSSRGKTLASKYPPLLLFKHATTNRRQDTVIFQKTWDLARVSYLATAPSISC